MINCFNRFWLLGKRDKQGLDKLREQLKELLEGNTIIQNETRRLLAENRALRGIVAAIYDCNIAIEILNEVGIK